MSSRKKDAATSDPEPPPPATLRFDLPYSAHPPRMINPELGLSNLVARKGHNAGYAIDITLLDAPDHRLIRSGVLLGHRVIDGRGEWYLGAPDWEPLLPAERIEPMSHAEIPEEFADLVRPFRRRATLGPVAALSLERAEFAFRDAGRTLALLRDDKVTVRRGGLTTARFREVMLTPVGPGLTPEQVDFLVAALGSIGGTPVARFPRLVTRLGAPATGLTDFPVPPAVDGASTFETFVSALLAGRLRELVEADLAVRTGAPDATTRLREVAVALRTDLQGLAAVLQPLWSEDLQEELDWLVEQADADLAAFEVATVGRPGTTLADRLRGERYLTLLERLVTASRAPQVGDSALLASGDVVEALLHEATERLVEAVDRVRVDAPQESWDEITEAVITVDRAAALAVRLDTRRVGKLRRRLEPALGRLAEVGVRAVRLGQIQAAGEAQGGPEAFAAGRLYEREVHHLDVARETFLESWPKVSARLVDDLPAPKKHRKRR